MSMRTETWTGDGEELHFNLPELRYPDSIPGITVGGTVKTPTTDYTVSDGATFTTITFVVAPGDGAVIVCTYSPKEYVASATYPYSDTIGEQVNRFDIVGVEWPKVETEMKDGSKRVRALTAAPRRKFSFEYDAITIHWKDELYIHFLTYGDGATFSITIPPRPELTDHSSPKYVVPETVTVRYVSFEFIRKERLDPVVHPSLRVVFEEVL